MMAARKALTMGAAVLSAVPVVVSPLTASAASPMTPTEWMEYYNVSSTDVVVGTLWTDEFFPVYYTMVMNIVQMPYINGVPIDPSSYEMRAGYYLREGVRHRGSVTLWSRRTYQNGGNSGALPLFAGDDCSISVSVTPTTGNTSLQYYIDYGLDNSSYPRVYIASALARRDMYVVASAPGFEYGTFSTTFTNAYFSYIYLGRVTGGNPVEIGDDLDAVLGYGGYPSTQLLGGATVMPSMPTSDLYPAITADNAMDYIEDVLNPWAVEQSPDIEPYLLSPVAPVEPIYPTGETVSGMPKEWTIENPALPSFSLDLQLPTADYSAVDVATPLEQNTNGIRFWWAMLGTLFDHFEVKPLVVLACALGLFILVLTRLGR